MIDWYNYKNYLIFLILLGLSGNTLNALAITPHNNSQYEILQRTLPVGQVNLKAKVESAIISSKIPRIIFPTATSANNAENGKAIYNQYCQACHLTGVAGAPKINDFTAWKDRLKQGLTILTQKVIQGYKAMPAKGGCVNCTNSQIQAAVMYMTKLINQHKND